MLRNEKNEQTLKVDSPADNMVAQAVPFILFV